MKKIASFFANAWRKTLWQNKVTMGGLALLVVVLAVTSLSSGCATTKSGLAREQAVYQAATHGVGAIQPV